MRMSIAPVMSHCFLRATRLARRCSSRSSARSQSVLAEHHFGCTVHILDDGFQHLDLARDIDLVIVTRGDLDDHMFPIGKLHDPVGIITRSADAVIVEDEEQVPADSLSSLRTGPKTGRTSR